MNKNTLKYYLIPVAYISSVMLMEFFPNIISIGLFLLVLLGSAIALMALIANRRQRTIQLRVALVVLALIPILDLSLGLTNRMRNEIKGEIVFSAMNKSFITSKTFMVRKKGTKLIAAYELSGAGFGDSEAADIRINGDTNFLSIAQRRYDDILVFDRIKKIMKSKNTNSDYRILVNRLIY